MKVSNKILNLQNLSQETDIIRRIFQKFYERMKSEINNGSEEYDSEYGSEFDKESLFLDVNNFIKDFEIKQMENTET